jgi:hypothetical protein
VPEQQLTPVFADIVILWMLPPETPRKDGGVSAPVLHSTGTLPGKVVIVQLGTGVAVGVGEACAPAGSPSEHHSEYCQQNRSA